jgi:hypothetical protein
MNESRNNWGLFDRKGETVRDVEGDTWLNIIRLKAVKYTKNSFFHSIWIQGEIGKVWQKRTGEK